jgi:hypothetical protein
MDRKRGFSSTYNLLILLFEGGQMRKIIVGFRLSKIEKNMLTKAARKMGCCLSDVIRWALRRELAEPSKREKSSRQHTED